MKLSEYLIMIYILIFIMIFMEESKGEWKLVLNEEFQNTTLDTEKWEIQNDIFKCHGNHIQQLNCNTNSTRNLRLINGTLAITTINEKYLDKNYTSGKITTKQGFTYGRFEIRAALPKGKMLRPAILMIPNNNSQDWPRNKQIDIMTNDQTLKLRYGIYYNYPEVNISNKGRFPSNTSLNNFHTYAIEWNQFKLKWFFDDFNYLSINISKSLGSIYTQNGNPFHSPFRLLIHLGVGGIFFPNQTLTAEDVMDWKCSLLIVDYVRIYEWVNGTKILDSKDDRVSTDNICSHVMPLITPKKTWKLVWNEEFDNQTLDTEKWEIENELIACHGNYNQQLNCNTNSTRNLRLINGTLAITTINEKYLDKDYTSGKITTKQGFTYGRFEIRTALPNGKMLKPAILMIPNNNSQDWPRNGQIDIMTNDQTLKLRSGIYYNYPEVYDISNKGRFSANTSLNNFHTYAIEWNQYELNWFFDDINYLTLNINKSLGSIYTKNGEPFDSPFRLCIYLGVGGKYFSDQILTVEEVMDWKCSLLIIDYVRIYEWVNGKDKRDSKDDRVSTDSICSHVMPLTKPKKKENQYLQFSQDVIIISVISSSLIIILISIIVFLFIRQKKLERIKAENSYENYNDIYDTEGNDAFNTSCEYEDRYEEITVNYVGIDEIAFKKNLYNNPIYSGTFNKT